MSVSRRLLLTAAGASPVAAAQNRAAPPDDGRSASAIFGALPETGGLVRLPPGRRPTNIPILATSPFSFVGDGAAIANLDISALPVDQDVLRVEPAGEFSHALSLISGISFENPTNGGRGGAEGIALRTDRPGVTLPKFTVRDTVVGDGAGAAFSHHHSAAAGPQGGLYGGLIENSILRGGVVLRESGDSNSIVRCILSGKGVGVDASLIAGASLLDVASNNITNDGGALRISAGHRFVFQSNNCENVNPGAAAANDGAVVNVGVSGRAIVGGVIRDNLVSAFGQSDARALIRLDNCRGTLVTGNVLLAGATGMTGIEIGQNCRDVRIGPNIFNAAVTTQISDLGTGTIGVVKTFRLADDWRSTSRLRFLKQDSGVVHLWGTIEPVSGLSPALVGTLPAGFRPDHPVRTMVTALQRDGVLGWLQMTVSEEGVVTILGNKDASTLDINVSLIAEGQANSTSFE